MGLWVGTTKGAFLLQDVDGPNGWSISGPFCDGWPINHVATDPASNMVWAAGGGTSLGAGVWRSQDGGKTWDRRNRTSNEEAEGHGACGHEVGHCVHNMVQAAGPGEVLYQQNHHGTYRSADGGRAWHNITKGLPSNFGFPITAHPTDPNTLWVLPLNGDSVGRFPPGASAAIYKSTDSGATWAAKTQGLPTENCFFTVLRQAMACDAAGVYFGTNSGSIFASPDEGETWSEIARHLPTILCVEVTG